MALHASFRSPRSFQSARLWNTPPLMKSSPVIRAVQPLRACQGQSVTPPTSPFHHDASRAFYVSDNDDDPSTHRKCQPVLLGLGLGFPASVSLPAMLHDDATVVNDSDFTSTMQSMGFETADEPPQKPLLCPLDAQDEISPIIPLPPSIDTADYTSVTLSTSASLGDLICEILPADKISRSTNKRLSTIDYICTNISSCDPITTQDITSNILRDEGSDREFENITLSSVDEPLTVDIADQGLSLDHGTFGISGFFGSGCECECALPHDEIVDRRTTDETQSQLCSIPIYHGEPRGCRPCGVTDRRVNARSSARHTNLRSSFIIRDPGIRTHQRKGVTRQPIEVSSPSMTPSPTSSPKFSILPAAADHWTESLIRHRPCIPNSKANRHRSSTICAQILKGRSSKPEVAWNDAKRGTLHSSNTRSPTIPDCSAGVSSCITRDEDDIFLLKNSTTPT